MKKIGGKFRTVALVLVLMSVMLLTSCATLGVGPDGDPMTPEEYFERYEHIIKLGVQVGVLQLLESNPTYADRVSTFAGYMKDYLDEGDPTLTLAKLEMVARERIDWSRFQPTEQLLVEAIITQVRAELENVLRANGLPEPPEKVVMYAGKFLGWVQEASAIFENRRGQRSTAPTLPPAE